MELGKDREKETFTFENIVGKGENAVSHNISYESRTEFLPLSYIYFVICKCFHFGPVSKFCRLEKN